MRVKRIKGKPVPGFLPKIRKPSQEEILEMLKNQNEVIRQRGIYFLRRKPSQAKALEMLKNPDEVIRQRGIYFLGMMKSAKAFAVDPLIKLLRTDPEGYIRWCAADALGKIGDKRAIKPVIEALSDPYWVVRAHAAEALGKLDAKEAIPELTILVNDARWPVQEAAANALGDLRAKEAVPTLQKFASRAKGLFVYPPVEDAAKRALKKILGTRK